MSRASGVDDEILSLPAGGGAVSSIGAGFDVDLNTGTSSSSIPLQLPPGPNAVRPELTLRYHSGAGDGMLGLGWTLSLPTVTREPGLDADAPKYTLLGVGRLRPVAFGVWRPEVDNLGQQIRHRLNDGPWELIDTRDTVHQLGSTPDAQILGVDGLPVMWMLERITDAFGNTIVYAWRRDGGQLYLERVTWGTWDVACVYEPRPDHLLDGHLGVLIETHLRCTRIELRASAVDSPLVRSWNLTYHDEAGAGRSLLASVTVVGHAVDGTEVASPPTRFTYTRTGAPHLVPLPGLQTGSLRSDVVDFVDLSGDGLPDAINLGDGGPSVWRNLGRGDWSGPRRLVRTPSPLKLGSEHVSFADMNGDGAADMVVLDRPMSGFYPFNTRPWIRPSADATSEGLFDRPVLWRDAPNYALSSPDVRLLDLNGDALTDLLVDTGRSWMAWTQNGTTGWSVRPRVLPSSESPPVRLRDPRVFIADLTGDGGQDIVKVQGSALRYWPACGPGRWGAERIMPIPESPPRLDPRRVLFADVDGDGCADLIYVDLDRVLVWWNTGSDRLSGPTVIRGTPASSPGGFRAIDLDGSDTIGLLFDLVSPDGRHRQCFLQLTGAQKPYLLANIDHATGSTTSIAYRSSTEFALDDHDDGQPWQTFHPFAVHCVSEVVRAEPPSGRPRRMVYRYHDGRFDPVSRTFVGFGRVTADAIGDDSAPTLRSTSEFHIGLDPADPLRALTEDERLAFGALRRRPLRVSVRGLNPDGTEQQPVTITRYQYATTSTSALDGSSVVFPYATDTAEERFDSQAAIGSTHRMQFLEVDQFGTVLHQRSTVTAADGTPARDLFINATMALGGTNLRLPARASQTGADGQILALSINYYDGPDHVGLPEGRATLGFMTRTEDLVLTDELVASVWGPAAPDLESLGYHRLSGESGWWVTRASRARSTEGGLPMLVSRGPRGAETTVRLDASSQFVTSITDARGNTSAAGYDVRSGQVSQLIDENGVTRQDLFDPLGRVVGTLFPGDAADAPSQSWTYRTSELPLRIDALQRIGAGAPAVTSTISYFDGLGKVLARLTPAGRIAGVQAATPTWVASETHRLNSRGLVQATWLPYLTSESNYAPPPDAEPHVLLSYNAAGQVVREDRPDGQVVTYERDASGVLIRSWQTGGVLFTARTPRERHDLDACGQMTRLSRWDGTRWVSQNYRWDTLGRLVQTTTADGAVIGLVYDLRGRPILHTSPETGRTLRLYDANGSEVLHRNAAGQEVRREYDALRRPLNVYYSGALEPDVSYDYLDANSPVPADGVRFRIGRLWKVRDAIGELTAAYDEYGRTVNSTRSGTPIAGSFATDVTYDRLGRTVSVVLPAPVDGGSREQVNYTYDEAARVQSASGVVDEAAYDVWGRVVRLRYANGTVTDNSFDARTGRLIRQTISAADGTPLSDQRVTYDSFGQLTSLTDSAGPTTFAYDGLQRLTGVQHPAGPPEVFAYSDGGNMTTGSAGAMSYVPNSGLLVSAGGQAYLHDAAGRLASGPYGSLRFDGADHLLGIQLTSGGQLEYGYDYVDRHTFTRRDGQLTYLSLSESFEVRDGRATQWLSFGGRRIVALSGNERRWLHPDLRGNVALVTDSASQIVFTGTFSAYGLSLGSDAPGSPSVPGAGFLGVTTDDSGLVRLGLRWYDPHLGRFISPDAMVAGLYVLDAWNPYVYAHNNPVQFVDPSGAWSFWGVLGVAVLVAVVVMAAVFTGGAALAGAGVLNTTLSAFANTLIMVGIGSFGGALAGGLSAMKAGGSVWGGAILGGILGGASGLAGGLIGSAISGSVGSSGTEFIVSGALQGAVGGSTTGFAVGFAGGKGTLGAALMSALRGGLWGSFFGELLGGGSHLLFIGEAGEQNYFELGTFNRYIPDKSGSWAAFNVGDNVTGTVEDAAVTGSHIAGRTFGAADVLGDIVDITAIHDIGQQTYIDPTQFIAFGRDGSLVLINVGQIASALGSGGLGLAASGSVLLDANGFSYANQVAMLLKAVPGLGNFLAWSDERKYGWYEDALKGFDSVFEKGAD